MAKTTRVKHKRFLGIQRHLTQMKTRYSIHLLNTGNFFLFWLVTLLDSPYSRWIFGSFIQILLSKDLVALWLVNVL